MWTGENATSNDGRFRVDGDKNMRLLAFAFTIVFVWTGPRLSESEAEAEEPTNRKVRKRTLSLVYFSASACDSDNAVFT